MKYCIIFFLFINCSLLAQTKGIVHDIDGNPIPYVSIWIEDENTGTSSEENGTFFLENPKNKNVLFSAVGFKDKILKFSEVSNVILERQVFQIDEVVVQSPKKRKQKTIDDYSGIVRVNSREITAKFFAYSDVVEKHPFVKQITFYASSKIENAKVRVRLLQANSDKSPGENLTEDGELVTLKKGSHDVTVSFENRNIKFPENGLFVVIEPLSINENKYYKEITQKGITGEKRKVKTFVGYEPFLGFLPSKENTTWYFNGKWSQKQQHTMKNPNSYSNILMNKYHNKFLELATNIVLTD